MFGFLAVALAIFLDRLFGELTIYHPLKGFSKIAITIEDAWHRQQNSGFKTSPPDAVQPEANPVMDQVEKIKGTLALLFLVLPFVAITGLLAKNLVVPLNFVFDVLILYLAIGAHNLKHHALNIQSALASGNIETAQAEVVLINNRDTNNASPQNLTTACLEAILEHGNDAMIAPIFWFVIGGAPLAVLYKLVNIVSNMWGVDHIHYKNFGWFALRVNSVINWIPARLTAFAYMLLGDMRTGWQCFNQQAKNWNSPNADLLMAAGAGSLHLEMGGDYYYHGELHKRPIFGMGKLADAGDIARACDLIDRTLVLWLAAVLLLALSRS